MAKRCSLIHYRVLARHRWVSGCTITESISDCDRYRRFTATIDGWRGFEIYCGALYEADHKDIIRRIIAKVKEIQENIRIGNDYHFYQDNRIC